jgi:hypothetical protein
VKAAKAASPTTTAELQKQLAILLADYPTLQKLLAVNSFADNTAVKMLLYKGEFPKYKDPHHTVLFYSHNCIITSLLE